MRSYDAFTSVADCPVMNKHLIRVWMNLLLMARVVLTAQLTRRSWRSYISIISQGLLLIAMFRIQIVERIHEIANHATLANHLRLCVNLWICKGDLISTASKASNLRSFELCNFRNKRRVIFVPWVLVASVSSFYVIRFPAKET